MESGMLTLLISSFQHTTYLQNIGLSTIGECITCAIKAQDDLPGSCHGYKSKGTEDQAAQLYTTHLNSAE